MSTDERQNEALRVLIVEDEMFLAMNLESELEMLGQDVVGMAPDAESALALAASESPDLALVDVNLRDGLTGPQIAADLVKKHVLVVFVTGSAKLVPRDCAGALGIIEKPWLPKTIQQLIPFVQAHRTSEGRPVLVSAPCHMQLAPAG